MKSVCKIILSVLSNILISVLVLLAVLLVGVRLFGFRPFTVLSGSMEPKYPVGALVYVREADTEELSVGDVITFSVGEEMIATHRIVDIKADADGFVRFVTKGDANESEDGTPVNENDVIGKVYFALPMLGYIAGFIQQPAGRYAAVFLCMTAVLLSFLPELLFPEEKEGKHTRPHTRN